MEHDDVVTLKNVAYIQSQTAAYYGELESMKAANHHADQFDHIERPHSAEDFSDLAGRFGLEINQVISTLVGL